MPDDNEKNENPETPDKKKKRPRVTMATLKTENTYLKQQVMGAHTLLDSLHIGKGTLPQRIAELTNSRSRK